MVNHSMKFQKTHPRRGAKSRMTVHISHFMINKLQRLFDWLPLIKWVTKIMWNNGRTFLSDHLFGWWQHNIPVLPKSHMNWMIKTTLPRKKCHVLLHPRKLTRPLKRDQFQPESSLRTIILKGIFIGHYIIRHHRSCFWFSWHLYHQRLSCSPFTSILLNQ